MSRVLPAEGLRRTISFYDRLVPVMRWANSVGIAVYFIMVILIFFDVFLRYIFRRPLSGSNEIIALMVGTVVALGLAYTQLEKGHVSVGLITDRLRPEILIPLRSVTTLLGIGIVTILTWQTCVGAVHMTRTNMVTPALAISLAPFVALLAFGLLLLIVMLLGDLLKDIAEGLRLNFSARRWLITIVISVLVVAGLMLLTQPTLVKLNIITVGIVAIPTILLFIFSGMPVAFVLLMISFVFMANVRGLDTALSMSSTTVFRVIASYDWSVLACFILMGSFVYASGLGRSLYYTAYKWFGHLPGGLAMATVGASTAFAAVVGDTLSATATFGATAFPEMERYKYSRSLATGTIVAGSLLGPMIPPSIGFIIYGLLSGQSIGKLFIAGIIPGLLLGGSFMALIYVLCRRNPNLGLPGERSNWKTRLVSLKIGGPVVALFLLILGGLYGGIFTPTEAGGIGACGAFLIGLAMRQFTWQKVVTGLVDASKVSCMIFFIIAGTYMLSYLFAASELPIILGEFLTGLAVSPLVIIIFMAVIYLILGCIIPPLATMLLTVPLFVPIVHALGFDLIWFGVIVNAMTNLGFMTPPFAEGCFALYVVLKKVVPLDIIFRGVIPFCLVNIVVVGLIIAFPIIATWLPNLIG